MHPVKAIGWNVPFWAGLFCMAPNNIELDKDLRSPYPGGKGRSGGQNP